MKYKHVPSALHNFGHSFVSLMNYVDDEYVVDVLEGIAREESDHQVEINFSTGKAEPSRALDIPVVSKSVKYWQDWLPKLLRSHGVNPEAINNARVRFRLTNMGREVAVEAQDDRGKQHAVFVRNTL